MQTICTSEYDILCDAVNLKKEFFLFFFSVEEPCTSTLTTPPSSLPGLPASYLKACGTGLGQGLPHPTAFLPRHPFYDPHLSGMLRHPYFTSKTSLFIFTFWYHYERNGNHLGCFMWGKEWNNVKINRKCIIPKCLCKIYNCRTSPVILRYYTVYTSTCTPVSVFMWWVPHIDVSINLMAVLTSFSLSIVYFTKMDVTAAPATKSRVGSGRYLAVPGRETRWSGHCLIVPSKILSWAIITW